MRSSTETWSIRVTQAGRNRGGEGACTDAECLFFTLGSRMSEKGCCRNT